MDKGPAQFLNSVKKICVSLIKITLNKAWNDSHNFSPLHTYQEWFSLLWPCRVCSSFTCRGVDERAPYQPHGHQVGAQPAHKQSHQGPWPLVWINHRCQGENMKVPLPRLEPLHPTRPSSLLSTEAGDQNYLDNIKSDVKSKYTETFQ